MLVVPCKSFLPSSCMNNDSYRTYVEKVQLLLLRVYWLLVMRLMMQMLTSVPAAIAAADASRAR